MKDRRTLVVLSLAASLLMVGVGMVVALLPQRIHEATGSLENVGFIASAFALAYLAAQLPVGMLADRHGAKPLLVTGYGLCGVAGLLFYALDTAGSVYLGRVIQGIGEAPIWALGPALLSLAYPLSKGRTFGIYNAAIHVGLTLGPLAGLLLNPTGTGSLPYLVFALLCFGGGVITFVLLPRTTVNLGAADKRRLAHVVLLLRQMRIAVLMAGILLYGAAYGTFISVLPISIATARGLGPQGIAFLFVVFYGGISLSQLAAGPMTDRYGRGVFMVGGLTLAAAGLAAFQHVPMIGTYGLLAVASIGLGAFCVASLAQLNDSVPSQLKGTVSGAYYFAWGLGYVLGPLAIGALEGNVHGAGYNGLAALLACLAMLLAVMERRR